MMRFRNVTSWGIKEQVLFLALAPALVIAAGLTFYDITTRLRDIEQALLDRGLAIVRQLSPASEFGVFSGNNQILASLTQSTLLESDVTSVVIISADGATLAADGRMLDVSAPVGEALVRPHVLEKSETLIFSAPIFQSQTEVEQYLEQDLERGFQGAVRQNEARVLGYVVIEMSRLSSIARKNQLIGTSLLITLAGLAVAALLALRIARQVTGPILALANAVARIGRGDLATRIKTAATGELAILERGVNNMAVALKAVQDAQEERRAILATVLDSLDALVYVADMETHELLFLNKYAQNTFGNVTGRICWQALQSNQNGPCSFCTNAKLLKPDGSPAEPFIWEFRNTINQHWYLIQDSAIKWVDDRIVRLEIATDITENKHSEAHIRRLERQIMDISEKERERIGHELHDGLGQQLTGIAFLSKALAQKLSQQSMTAAGDAELIVSMINQAISETRQLARGLQPVEVEENGLMSALESLAASIEKLFQVSCEFRCNTPVLVQDRATANHLYRIVQEAVNNAIRHGHARNIVITLSAPQGKPGLSIDDDGIGFMVGQPDENSGMGLQIMHYRANMIGAALEIESEPGRGTRIGVHY